jgi:hypothetical protein
VLVIGTINLKATLNQTLCSPPYINSDPDLDSELNSNLDYLDLYLDLNTEPNMDNELDINAHPNLKLGLEDLGLNSKAEEILKDITELRDKGLVKLNHTSYTKKLWKREGEL